MKKILYPLLGLCVFFIISCESPLRTTLLQVVADYSTPTTEVTPWTSGGLDKYSPITIQFSEEMNPETYHLSGSMAPESDGGVWSSGTGGDNSRLVISPLTTWSLGSGQTLNITCFDMDNYEAENLDMEFGVLDGIIYVRESGGSDNNPGTATDPLKTIQPAIELAAYFYPDSQTDSAEVRVAEGYYEVDSFSTSAIVLEEGISLLGGYSESNWNNRDWDLYESIIEDEGFIDSSALDSVPETNRSKAIDCGYGLTDATVLEGFTIKGSNATTSYAISCVGSNVIIRNNMIDGGTGDNSAGIRIKDASPEIRNNTIVGSVGANEIAIGIITSNSQSIIEGNTIDGGSSTACSGIFNDNSSPHIINNSIRGGTSVTFSSGSLTVGINNWTSDPLIEGNRIYGGRGVFSVNGISNMDNSNPTIRNNMIYGGFGSSGDVVAASGIISEESGGYIQNNTISGGDPGVHVSSIVIGIRLDQSSPTIENNLIFTSGGLAQYGVFEYDSTSHPIVFRYNDIFNCSEALYNYWDGSSTGLAYNDLSNLDTAFTWSNNNLTNIVPDFSDLDGADGNILTMDDNLWNLTSSTSASIKTGGVDLSSDFSTDLEDIELDPESSGSRTVPWSIGAYETDL